MLYIHNETLLDYLRTSYRRAEIKRLYDFLLQSRTFRFRHLDNGLFPASSSANDDDASGYQNAWVRDNVQIAYAHFFWGDRATAARNTLSLMSFFHSQRLRMQQVIESPCLAADPMKRPHIRFDALKMKEIPQKWPHAQNDALGYFMWFFSKMAQEGVVGCDESAIQTLVDLVRYLNAIEYWQDQDSGHWEETRKVSASSIGTVVAGLQEFYTLCRLHNFFDLCFFKKFSIDEGYVINLIQKGQETLQRILPYECLEPDDTNTRRYDAALLFLIYPLNIVSAPMASTILKDVSANLEGHIGIRRYPGDSYWCADYRDLFSPGDRSNDFSEKIQSRDTHLKPGEEAQWCIFDPIISCIYGMRVLENGKNEDRRLQAHYLNRSLGQLTKETDKVTALQCPEAYFIEHGSYHPNDHVPLQWTQANLRMALHWLELTAEA